MQSSKNLKPNTRNISYLNRDFSDFRKSLIDYAKYYFPNTNKDFGAGSVGLMYIEQASYVGDVASFYIDNQFQESMITMASQRKNIVNRAISTGYKIKPTTTSQVKIDVYQLVPSITINGETTPDIDSAQSIKEGMSVSTSDGIEFITLEPVDFSVDTPSSPIEITSYQRDQNGLVQNYILKKQVACISATRKIKTVTIGDAVPYYKIQLEELDVIGIENIVDSDNNKWYEVEHLAQDTISIDVPNNLENEQSSADSKNVVPYILKYIRTSNKFITTVDENNITTIGFGSGTDELFDEEIIPSPDTLSTYSTTNYINSNNLLRNNRYGKSPRNTTLTITYICGGGISSNVSSNSIVNISSVQFDDSLNEMTPDELKLKQSIRNSIRVNNPEPAFGGDGPESDESIRQNSMLSISAQNRAITSEDYKFRIYSMPKKFGSISKTVVQKSNNRGFSDINVYVLTYDSNKNLSNPNDTIIKNLTTYLEKYRGLTDEINIINGSIINIGIDFKISVQRGYSKKEVLSNAIEKVKEFFDIDLFQFNQSINLSHLNSEILTVEGVQSVAELKVGNLTNQNGNYSSSAYDISNAIKNNIIYPSLDPSVFEVKFPTKDIRGTCI